MSEVKVDAELFLENFDTILQNLKNMFSSKTDDNIITIISKNVEHKHFFQEILRYDSYRKYVHILFHYVEHLEEQLKIVKNSISDPPTLFAYKFMKDPRNVKYFVTNINKTVENKDDHNDLKDVISTEIYCWYESNPKDIEYYLFDYTILSPQAIFQHFERFYQMSTYTIPNKLIPTMFANIEMQSSNLLQAHIYFGDKISSLTMDIPSLHVFTKSYYYFVVPAEVNSILRALFGF